MTGLTTSINVQHNEGEVFYVVGYFDVAIREDFMGNPESQSKIE